MDPSEFEDLPEIMDQSPARPSAGDISEAEFRIDLALHYKAFLGDGDFFDSDSPAASHVSSELRAFAQERLEVLLGMRAETAAPTAQLFTEEQVEALRAVADRILRAGSEKTIAPVAPKVRKVAAPERPVVQSKPADAPLPQVRKRKVRTGAKKPAPAPVAETASAPVKPAATAKPAPTPPAPVKTKEVSNKKEASKSPKTADTAEDGEIFVEDGIRYVWARNEAGGRYKKTVTTQVRNPDAVPMPDANTMAMLTQQQANEAVAASLAVFTQKMKL